jgi:protein-tyrosine kinase
VSRLFKALERAEQEGTLRRQGWSWQEASAVEDLQDAAPPSEAPAGAFTPPPEPKAQPRAGLNPRLITLLTPEAFETEPYRILGHMLKQLHRDSGLRVVAITSPGAAEGKTTAAINLAGVLAQSSEKRVLLLEAELRRPVMTSYLNLHHPGRRGLVQAILDASLSLNSVVRPCSPFNLDVLPAGRSLTSPYDLLRAPRLEALMTEARQHYDWVIVDAPPMVPFADCRIIEQWVDSFLVLVAAHKTPRKLLEESLATLDPGKVIGLVFNRDEHLVPGYYSYHSYLPSPNGSRKGWRLPWRRKKTGGN